MRESSENVGGFDQNLTNEVWKKSLDHLQRELDPQIFSAYIKPLELSAFDSERFELTVIAPSKFVCQHVDSYYRERFTSLLNSELGSQEQSVSLRFLVNNNKKLGQDRQAVVVKKLPIVKAAPIVRKENLPDLNPRYTFNNFVVGNSNQFCHAAALRVVDKPGLSYNPLFIYGGVGLGKTHILHAIGNALLERRPAAKILYMSSETFTNELIQALRSAKMDEFKRRMRSIELLLIDDVQFLCGKERTQEEFFHTFNALYNAKHQIVMSSDKMPQDIVGLEERLQTRFAWGLTADLQAPDFETRVAILKRKAQLEGLSIPDEAVHFIGEKFSSNVRELEGALTRLIAQSSMLSKEITLEFASQALKPLLQPKVIKISVPDIKKVVATHFNLKVSDLSSKRRTKNLSFPRHIAMYLCRKHTTSSYPEIGHEFGGRDHSSVIHASHVVSSKLKESEELKQIVTELERHIFG